MSPDQPKNGTLSCSTLLMSHYKIILDEGIFNEFIQWLPELQINERLYVCLFARKKYCAEVKYIKTDKAQCKRFLSSKEELYNKIKQLEVPINSYVLKGTTIPQEALALYISINPRDLNQATRTSLVKFAELLGRTYNGHNPVFECMSEVHKSVSRKLYYDLDFDGIEWDQIKNEVLQHINKEAISVLKTKNGFHLIIHLRKIEYGYVKTWYKKITAIEGCDVRGDVLLPVPGCTQGGFIPHFINI